MSISGEGPSQSRHPQGKALHRAGAPSEHHEHQRGRPFKSRRPQRASRASAGKALHGNHEHQRGRPFTEPPPSEHHDQWGRPCTQQAPPASIMSISGEGAGAPSEHHEHQRGRPFTEQAPPASIMSISGEGPSQSRRPQRAS